MGLGSCILQTEREQTVSLSLVSIGICEFNESHYHG